MKPISRPHYLHHVAACNAANAKPLPFAAYLKLTQELEEQSWQITSRASLETFEHSFAATLQLPLCA